MRRFAIWLMLLFASTMSPAAAHEVRPALLQIEEVGSTQVAVTWKQPVVGDAAVRLVPHLSGGWLETTPAERFVTASFLIERWIVSTGKPARLSDQTVSIEGLDKTITDVIVDVRGLNGHTGQLILRPDQASRSLVDALAEGAPVAAYLRLGIEHILTGVDHLMFVLGLTLLVSVRWCLLSAITAFTVAHSMTLAASALGLVHVNAALIEALVALSIVFVAAELAESLRGKIVLTQRKPWVVAFIFGLLHGFAFASSLAEVGLPQDAIPLSLFLFNVGVESGQLLFVGATIAVILLFRSRGNLLSPRGHAVGRWLAPYAIGSCAAAWFLERTFLAFT
jgi:hydrogenase/urease accessory protein HupE